MIYLLLITLFCFIKAQNQAITVGSQSIILAVTFPYALPQGSLVLDWPYALVQPTYALYQSSGLRVGNGTLALMDDLNYYIPVTLLNNTEYLIEIFDNGCRLTPQIQTQSQTYNTYNFAQLISLKHVQGASEATQPTWSQALHSQIQIKMPQNAKWQSLINYNMGLQKAQFLTMTATTPTQVLIGGSLQVSFEDFDMLRQKIDPTQNIQVEFYSDQKCQDNYFGMGGGTIKILNKITTCVSNGRSLICTLGQTLRAQLQFDFTLNVSLPNFSDSLDLVIDIYSLSVVNKVSEKPIRYLKSGVQLVSQNTYYDLLKDLGRFILHINDVKGIFGLSLGTQAKIHVRDITIDDGQLFIPQYYPIRIEYSITPPPMNKAGNYSLRLDIACDQILLYSINHNFGSSVVCTPSANNITCNNIQVLDKSVIYYLSFRATFIKDPSQASNIFTTSLNVVQGGQTLIIASYSAPNTPIMYTQGAREFSNDTWNLAFQESHFMALMGVVSTNDQLLSALSSSNYLDRQFNVQNSGPLSLLFKAPVILSNDLPPQLGQSSIFMTRINVTFDVQYLKPTSTGGNMYLLSADDEGYNAAQDCTQSGLCGSSNSISFGVEQNNGINLIYNYNTYSRVVTSNYVTYSYVCGNQVASSNYSTFCADLFTESMYGNDTIMAVVDTFQYPFSSSGIITDYMLDAVVSVELAELDFISNGGMSNTLNNKPQFIAISTKLVQQYIVNYNTPSSSSDPLYYRNLMSNVQASWVNVHVMPDSQNLPSLLKLSVDCSSYPGVNMMRVFFDQQIDVSAYGLNYSCFDQLQQNIICTSSPDQSIGLRTTQVGFSLGTHVDVSFGSSTNFEVLLPLQTINEFRTFWVSLGTMRLNQFQSSIMIPYDSQTQRLKQSHQTPPNPQSDFTFTQQLSYRGDTITGFDQMLTKMVAVDSIISYGSAMFASQGQNVLQGASFVGVNGFNPQACQTINYQAVRYLTFCDFTGFSSLNLGALNLNLSSRVSGNLSLQQLYGQQVAPYAQLYQQGQFVVQTTDFSNQGQYVGVSTYLQQNVSVTVLNDLHKNYYLPQILQLVFETKTNVSQSYVFTISLVGQQFSFNDPLSPYQFITSPYPQIYNQTQTYFSVQVQLNNGAYLATNQSIEVDVSVSIQVNGVEQLNALFQIQVVVTDGANIPAPQITKLPIKGLQPAIGVYDFLAPFKIVYPSQFQVDGITLNAVFGLNINVIRCELLEQPSNLLYLSIDNSFVNKFTFNASQLFESGSLHCSMLIESTTDLQQLDAYELDLRFGGQIISQTTQIIDAPLIVASTTLTASAVQSQSLLGMFGDLDVHVTYPSAQVSLPYAFIYVGLQQINPDVKLRCSTSFKAASFQNSECVYHSNRMVRMNIPAQDSISITLRLHNVMMASNGSLNVPVLLSDRPWPAQPNYSSLAVGPGPLILDPPQTNQYDFTFLQQFNNSLQVSTMHHYANSIVIIDNGQTIYQPDSLSMISYGRIGEQQSYDNYLILPPIYQNKYLHWNQRLYVTQMQYSNLNTNSIVERMSCYFESTCVSMIQEVSSPDRLKLTTTQLFDSPIVSQTSVNNITVYRGFFNLLIKFKLSDMYHLNSSIQPLFIGSSSGEHMYFTPQSQNSTTIKAGGGSKFTGTSYVDYIFLIAGKQVSDRLRFIILDRQCSIIPLPINPKMILGSPSSVITLNFSKCLPTESTTFNIVLSFVSMGTLKLPLLFIDQDGMSQKSMSRVHHLVGNQPYDYYGYLYRFQVGLNASKNYTLDPKYKANAVIDTINMYVIQVSISDSKVYQATSTLQIQVVTPNQSTVLNTVTSKMTANQNIHVLSALDFTISCSSDTGFYYVMAESRASTKLNLGAQLTQIVANRILTQFQQINYQTDTIYAGYLQCLGRTLQNSSYYGMLPLRSYSIYYVGIPIQQYNYSDYLNSNGPQIIQVQINGPAMIAQQILITIQNTTRQTDNLCAIINELNLDDHSVIDMHGLTCASNISSSQRLLQSSVNETQLIMVYPGTSDVMNDAEVQVIYLRHYKKIWNQKLSALNKKRLQLSITNQITFMGLQQQNQEQLGVIQFLNVEEKVLQNFDYAFRVALFYRVSQDCILYIAVVSDSKFVPDNLTTSFFTATNPALYMIHRQYGFLAQGFIDNIQWNVNEQTDYQIVYMVTDTDFSANKRVLVSNSRLYNKPTIYYGSLFLTILIPVICGLTLLAIILTSYWIYKRKSVKVDDVVDVEQDCEKEPANEKDSSIEHILSDPKKTKIINHVDNDTPLRSGIPVKRSLLTGSMNAHVVRANNNMLQMDGPIKRDADGVIRGKLDLMRYKAQNRIDDDAQEIEEL